MSFYMSCLFFILNFGYFISKEKEKNDICPVVINETLNKTLEISF